MTLGSSFPLLLDLFLKSAAILVLAGVAGSVWRRASAANRHMIWLAALLVLLLLPLTKLANPQWTYVWAPKTQRVAAAPAVVTREAPPISVGREAADVAPPLGVQRSVTVNWAAVGVVTWLVGMGIVLLHRAAVRWRLARLAARSRPVSAERWLGLVGDWPAGVQIRESTECRVPLAAGVWRPIVLLPTDALDWSAARLTTALRHELGHIRRRDCLSRLLLDLACAIYWMNPLVWFAARSMRLAQEQACDDLVLRSGASAADYATQLVEVVRGLSGAAFPVRHALAMAQPSTLETRVRAIVDADRDRSAMSRATSVLGAVAALFALALCGVVRVEAAEKRAAPKPEAAGEKSGVQIVIEAKFFEITEESLGVLGASLGPDGVPPPTGLGGGIVAVLPAVQAADVLKSLERANGVDLLSTPRVTTRSGQQAVVEIMKEFRYPTEYDKDQKTRRWVPKTFETKNVGITFGILATAAADGTLDLELAPEVVKFKGFVDLDAPGKPMISFGGPAEADHYLSAPTDFGKLLPASVVLRN